MKLGNFDIGQKAFLIAEIGNNHNGDFETAKKLIIEAAKAGADAVKFQTFNPDLYVDKKLPIVAHAKGVYKTQHERLQSIRLTEVHYYELKKLSDEQGVIFCSTPFDTESADFLDKIVPFFKVASGDLTNVPLLKHVAAKGKPVIISSGMGNEKEIQRAINIFPKESLVLLHCVARYPTPSEEANMLSIPFLRKRFNVPVGYSDHTIGLTACRVAAAMGAVVIEKHFTLDKSQSMGDHVLSADPGDLAELVMEIRDIEKTLGAYGKPVDNQKDAARVMRRSLYARVNIKKGDEITLENIVPLRPPDGIPAEAVEDLTGKTSLLDIKEGTCLKYEMFSD